LKGHNSVVRSVAYSPDGKTLASGSWDYTAKLWDVASGKEQITFKDEAHFNSIAMTADGKLLASGGDDKAVKLWDTGTGKELRTLKGHTDQISSVALSVDGKTLASGSFDKTVRLWEVMTGKELVDALIGDPVFPRAPLPGPRGVQRLDTHHGLFAT